MFLSLALLFIAALFCFPTAPTAAQGVGTLEVMTFNLRYAHATPPNLWADRRPVVRELIERWAPDVIGTQEGLYSQIADIAADLGGYSWIGLGREGGSHGELMAVFYRTDRLAALEFDHFWLSDTPERIGSRSWGNRYPRMVTWVRFRDRERGREFYLVNTHLDHEVQLARERSAELILERLETFDPVLPVVLVGDFNADAGDNPVYQLLVGRGGFVDSWRAAGCAEPPFGTFHDFEGVDGAAGRARIDWILVGGAASILEAEILTFARDGQYPSDHFPVVARLEMDRVDTAAAEEAGERCYVGGIETRRTDG
jgi:endonuclease/exonuclease/phosphatase family metal-dependent hydrolase